MSEKPEVPAKDAPQAGKKPEPQKVYSGIRETTSDDPIYTRGFAIGVKKRHPISQPLVEPEAKRQGYTIGVEKKDHKHFRHKSNK